MKEKILIFVHELQVVHPNVSYVISNISRSYEFPKFRTTTFTMEYVLHSLQDEVEGEDEKRKVYRTELYYKLKKRLERHFSLLKDDLIEIFKVFSPILRRNGIDIFFIDEYFLNGNTVSSWIGLYKNFPTKFVYHQIGTDFRKSKTELVVNRGFNVVSLKSLEPSTSLTKSVELLKPIIIGS